MYVYLVTGTEATCIAQAEYDKVIQDERFPAQEEHPDCHAILSYTLEQGIHWEYIPFTPREKRQRAYETEPIIVIAFGAEPITVDEANKLWMEYSAEGDDEKTAQLSTLIANAKQEIRERYPDTEGEE